VWWSDKVTFYIREDNTVFYVTRGPGEEWEDKNLKPTFESGGQVFVCGLVFVVLKWGLSNHS
jgi:hypothetical protein